VTKQATPLARRNQRQDLSPHGHGCCPRCRSFPVRGDSRFPTAGLKTREPIPESMVNSADSLWRRNGRKLLVPRPDMVGIGR